MSPADDRRAEREAFRALVAEVADPVRRYLWRRTDEATADEVLGETLVVLWRRADDVPEERIAWSIGIARKLLGNAQRGARRRDGLVQRILSLDPPAQAAPDAAAGDDHDDHDDHDRDAAVRRALARLRPGEAELLRLWVWEDLEPRQIAAVLGITANAASVRLHRAKRRFAELLGKDAPVPGQDAVKEGETR